MRIASNTSGTAVVVLHEGVLSLFETTSAQARARRLDLSPFLPAAGGILAHRLVACDAFVGVLIGIAAKQTPSGFLVQDATLVRFAWDLTPWDEVPLGLVDERCLSLSADGSHLVVIAHDAAPDPFVNADWEADGNPRPYAWIAGKIIDLNSQRETRYFQGEYLSGATLSRDGLSILSGSSDQGGGAVLLLDAAARTRRLPCQFLDEPTSSPGLFDATFFGAFSESGRYAALSHAGWGGRVLFLYDLETKQALWSQQEPHSGAAQERSGFAFPVIFSDDARFLFWGTPDAVLIYETASGRRVAKVAVEGGVYEGFLVNPTRQTLVVPGAELREYAIPNFAHLSNAGP